MTESLRFVGVDPGFAEVGVALMRMVGPQELVYVDAFLLSTKKDNSKKDVRAKSDELRRLTEIVGRIRPITTSFAPDVVAFEECPNVRNSGVSRKIGMAWGACYAELTRHPGTLALEYAPRRVKANLTADTNASKADVVSAVLTRWPEVGKLEVPASKMEHVADAVAVCWTALQDPMVQQLFRAIGNR